MRSIGRPVSVLVVTSALAIPLLPGSAEAGLFDEIGRIFSADGDVVYEPPSFARRRMREREYAPLSVTVRPKRVQKRQIANVPRARAPKQQKLTGEAAALMDPDKNPTWYLVDPTLRIGDIVVIKGEVLVFQGGRVPYSRDAFTTLGRSRLTESEKLKVRAMSGVREDPQVSASAPNRAVAAVGNAGE